jgi:hypothetical protein
MKKILLNNAIKGLDSWEDDSRKQKINYLEINKKLFKINNIKLFKKNFKRSKTFI